MYNVENLFLYIIDLTNIIKHLSDIISTKKVVIHPIIPRKQMGIENNFSVKGKRNFRIGAKTNNFKCLENQQSRYHLGGNFVSNFFHGIIKAIKVVDISSYSGS